MKVPGRPAAGPRRSGCIVTFTNLFPSAVLPTHGLFVQDRMRRVAARSGLDWQVVCPVPSVPPGLRRAEHRALRGLPERELVDGVEVWHPRYFHLPGLSTRAQPRRIARAALPVVSRLAQQGPIVLDAHYAWPDGVAALAIAQQLGVRCLVTARGSDVNLLARLPGLRTRLRATLPAAFQLLAVSDDLRRKFAEAAGVPPERVLLARNGVDLERFRPGDPAAARGALGLPESGRLLLGVGRLVRGKGFDELVPIAAATGSRVVLIGDGPERGRLLRLGGERLLLLGNRPQSEVATAYQACDLLLLPSAREGWPNVVTEALASGLPVVAYAVGGVPEILTDPRLGRVVPPGDARGLGAAAADLLAAPPSRAEVAGFARRFAWEPTIELLVRRFHDALGSAGSAPFPAGPGREGP